MELKEILRFADERVFAKTGKHLDDLQEAILSEAIHGRKYAKIAQDRDCSEGYVRVAAAELWKILSEVLGEEVSKVNVRSILERAKYTNVSPAIASSNVTINNNLNICKDTGRSPAHPPQPQETPKHSHIDLGDAPTIFSFYDSPGGDRYSPSGHGYANASRADELLTLERWIVQDRCRLVELLGMNGIGKTA